MSDQNRIEFTKDFSRDTTLFLQGLWAKGLTVLIKEKVGWDNPHLPFIAHFVNDGVVEIWQHKKAYQWFLDRLSAQNNESLEFLKGVLEEYKNHLAELKIIHQKEYLSAPNELAAYKELVYKGALGCTLFFYVGVDDRNPAEAREMAVASRKMGDFFADNDAFIRRNVARRGNFSEELAGMVLPDEILNLPEQSVLEERLKHFLLIDGQTSFMGTLEQYSVTHPEFVFEKQAVAKADFLKGQTAAPGKARGEVKIVKKQAHINKVKEGDILVMPMTTPDFLPAMKKAAAFVTDEGGITCHAAIVAREMNKPCVIGTKIATEVLHDGDLVEVDAEKGIVKIIR